MGDPGAAQPLPRIIAHGPVEARVVDRTVLHGGTVRLSIPAELGYRHNLATPLPGSGDPVCGGGSVAWHGQPLPGGEQGTLAPLAFVNPATLNNQGQIAFYAQVEGADRNQGIFTADADGLQVIVLGCGGTGGSGETAGCGDPSPVGGTFSGFFGGTFFLPDINDNGDVLFLADIHEGDAPRGLFLYRAATGLIEKVAAVGDSLAEGVIDQLGSGNLNNDGIVVFVAKLAGAAETDIFLWDGTTAGRYVAVGDPAPGGGVFSLLVSEFLGFPDGTSMPGGPLPGLNDEGQITFRSLVNGGEAERGIFLSQGGVHEWLVRVGEPVPGGGTYVDFQAAQLNDAGEVAFLADIDEGGEFNTGGWIAGSPGNWRRAVAFFDEIGGGEVVGLAFSRNPMTALSDQGDLLLWTTLRFPDESEAATMILSRANGERLVVAQQGEPTPDGGTYGSMDAWPALNDAHQGQVGAGTPGLPGQLNTHFVLTFCSEGGVPVLDFDPSDLDFGDVEVGTTSPPQTAMLHNTGDGDATGIAFIGLPDAGFEADASACGDTVPAGGSCGVSVTFSPSVVGPATATLHAASDEGAAADLGLSGNGVGADGPIADIMPDAFSFDVPQGGADSGTLTIGNLGDADLGWSLEEAEAMVARTFVPVGAPYRYGLAEMPAFHAPVSADRASGPGWRQHWTPADRVVLPALQPMAINELTESFDDITQLPGAGWAMINNSEPTGPSSWFQGNETIFPSHEGSPNAYIAANFESTDGAGDSSNWLLTPEVTIVNGTELCFWTRTTELFEEFLDRLEVRMSVAGDSIDVGDTAESVGDFTELLLTIEPDLELPNEYPEEWTKFCVTVRERSREPVTGRFAFRYWVTDSGPNGSNGDYIGIDTVSVTQPGDIPPADCDNPVDIPWLTADPTSGTTAPGSSEPVTVTVDATDLDAGEHTARLCVTTNDPSASLVEVPVTLTVTEKVPTFEGLDDLPGARRAYGL